MSLPPDGILAELVAECHSQLLPFANSDKVFCSECASRHRDSHPRLTESVDRLFKFDRRMLVPPTRSGVAHNSETPAFTLIDNGEIVRSGMTEHECKLNLVWYISQCALYRDTLLSFTPGVSLGVLESFCQLRPAPANRSLLRP